MDDFILMFVLTVDDRLAVPMHVFPNRSLVETLDLREETTKN